MQTTIYRPPSVHARGRGVTQKIALIARSPLSSVAGSGEQPSPQALLTNVGSAVAFLADPCQQPPEIVHHPWEGMTACELLTTLGGKRPLHLPEKLVDAMLTVAVAFEPLIPRVAPNRRRAEVLWKGQRVAESWLTRAGWTPVGSREVWASLAC